MKIRCVVLGHSGSSEGPHAEAARNACEVHCVQRHARARHAAAAYRDRPLPLGGGWSLAYCAVLIAMACGLTFGAAWLSYRWIEKPFIKLGKRLTRPAPPSSAAATLAA